MIRLSLFLLLFLPSLFAAAQNQPRDSDDRSKINREHELHYQNLILHELHSREAFQKELELTEGQIQSIKSAHEQFVKEFEDVYEKRGQLYSNLQKGTYDKETYNKALEASKQAEETVKEKFQANARSILLPYQRQLIVKRAKRIRVTSVKDEFETPVILAREKGLSPEAVRKIAKAVNEARKEHYAKLKEIRQRYEKKVLAEMDPAIRRQFTQMYGAFYDYESERVIELTKDESDDD